jgi:pimeloyl-ACP methyl ester carboxylesterase
MSFLTIDEWQAAAAPAGRLRLIKVDSGGSSESPVLLFLHGAGQASEWLDQAPHVMAHLSPPFQALQGKLGDVVVLAPQARIHPTKAWDWSLYVADIAQQLLTRYAGRRIVAAGFSRGGLGVLQLLAHPSRLVSAWAIVDPQPPNAAEDQAIMSAVANSPAGWVRYGPQHPNIRAFGTRLERRCRKGARVSPKRRMVCSRFARSPPTA